MTMRSRDREFKESPVEQGIDERIAWPCNLDTWSAAPSSPAAEAKKWNAATKAWDDITGSVFPVNSPSITATTIALLSPLVPQAVGDKYRIEVQWTESGNTLEAFFICNITE